jgi:hypothetical protein
VMVMSADRAALEPALLLYTASIVGRKEGRAVSRSVAHLPAWKPTQGMGVPMSATLSYPCLQLQLQLHTF